MMAIETSWRPAPDTARARGLSLRWSRDRTALSLIVLAVLVGAALRVAMARGDLWLDEIWSLMLVRAVHSPGAVFWGISHDNNHFLNSLWIYALGPDRPGWVYRAPAVALGTLSVALAGRIGLRRGRAGGVAAALLAATALPLVVYGSEARGYAGLIAFSLLAIEAFERTMADPVDAGSGWRRPSSLLLGVAVAFGSLYHLTMLATLAVLVLTALLRFRERGLSPRAALDATFDRLGPALLAPMPAIAAVMAGIRVRGSFTLGGRAPFEMQAFADGYGGQLRVMLGLPGSVPPIVVFGAAGLALVAILRVGPLDRVRRNLALSSLVILPGGMMLAHLPNLEFPRYFLVPGLVLLLAQADLVGRLWDGGGAVRRAVAVLVLGATLAGQATADASALETGRGHYGDAIALMAGERGGFSYASDDRTMAKAVIDFMAPRRGLVGLFVPPDDICTTPPDWYIDVMDPGAGQPASITASAAGCRVRFDRQATFPTTSLSGMRWTLYRRAG